MTSETTPESGGMEPNVVARPARFRMRLSTVMIVVLVLGVGLGSWRRDGTASGSRGS